MTSMTMQEMEVVEGGYEKYTACGAAVAITAGATFFFGVVGFALTVNKALTICAIEALA